ncbi:hypothetical protein ACQP00_04960 [Dactylosporangium sp. CS-047395]|uniref:hypothetical protein n=1 Tax=Dactylosporangium sp. CS-047395 TaxID=3239936 RepID=UPI003D8D705E
MRLWPIAIVAAVVVLAGGGMVAARMATDDDAAAAVADGPAIAGECPAAWSGEAPKATRKGPLVPTGARSAVLCSYADPQYAIGASRRVSERVDELTGYLNGLPAEPRKDSECLLSAGTEHAIVFEYAGREPVVAVARGCAWDQDGGVRYQGDIRRITAFWSVTFRD